MTIKQLVFAGAGARYPVYAGALLALEQAGLLSEVEAVAGASTGALVAALFSLGYTPDEIAEAALELDFASWLDASVLTGPVRLLTRYGWHPAHTLRSQLERYIKRKTGRADSTFMDCSTAGHKQLFIVGSNVTQCSARIFPDAISQHLSLVDALRISLSVPLLFATVPYQGDLYVDGGLMDNYPLHLFDAPGRVNAATLGFQVEHTPRSASSRVWTPQSYFSNLYELSMRRQEHENARRIEDEDRTRTISVPDAGVPLITSKLDRASKLRLIDAGRETTRAFLAARRATPQLVQPPRLSALTGS